jgi:hypothetical protein
MKSLEELSSSVRWRAAASHQPKRAQRIPEKTTKPERAEKDETEQAKKGMKSLEELSSSVRWRGSSGRSSTWMFFLSWLVPSTKPERAEKDETEQAKKGKTSMWNFFQKNRANEQNVLDDFVELVGISVHHGVVGYGPSV